MAAELCMLCSTTRRRTRQPGLRRGSQSIRASRFTSHRYPLPGSIQVERFFAEITRKRIPSGTFKSVTELEAAIEGYLLRHNANPKPFVWTKSAKVNEGQPGKSAMELRVSSGVS